MSIDLDLIEEVEDELDLIPDFDPVPDELQDGDIVIEAGAYEGAWAKKVCEQRDGCKMYAFEPATRAYKMALEKLKDCPNVILRCVALGKQAGTMTLYDCLRDGANTTVDTAEAPNQSESVSIVDTAEALEPLGEIGLMHLNAEGGEVTILERLIETGLIGRAKMILVQWHPYHDEMRARIAEVMRRLAETHEFEPCVAWGCWKRKDIERKRDD